MIHDDTKHDEACKNRPEKEFHYPGVCPADSIMKGRAALGVAQ